MDRFTGQQQKAADVCTYEHTLASAKTLTSSSGLSILMAFSSMSAL
jgi:hypothetical protein